MTNIPCCRIYRMRRRTFLKTVPAISVMGVAGCTASAKPDITMKQGSGTLHPISEQYIAGGLDAQEDEQLLTQVLPDAAPDVLGPDADGSIADSIRNPGLDWFHVVVQFRSSPAAPIEIWPITGDAFEWRGESTLRATVELESWESFDRIEDETRREALRDAEEVVFTGVWSLSPDVDDLPDDVILQLE